MEKQFEDYFKKNRERFDFSEPNIGHFERFENRLKKEQKTSSNRTSFKWQWLAVAASVLLVFGYWLGNQNLNQSLELGDVSPKMEETQNFYMATIQKEMDQISNKRNDSNQKIIDDAFKQLDILEANYQRLTLELKESNADKRVVYAMIANFQSRLTVLQNLMDRLEEFEDLVQQENRV